MLAESALTKSKEHVTLAEGFNLESEKGAFSDAVTLATLTGFLSTCGATYRIAHESDAGLSDLRLGPAVLIGALNNDWGIQLAHELRFTFSFDVTTLTASILDRGAPSWSLRLDVPFTSVREDRGVVTRVIDATTGQPMVLAGGVTMLGTLAAGELLTNPAYMPEGDWGVETCKSSSRPASCGAQPLHLACWKRGSGNRGSC